MPSQKKLAQEAAATLERLQKKHKQWAKKVDQSKRKLMKRTQRLQKLEKKLARNEQQAHAAVADASGQPVRAGDAGLRPARLIVNPKAGLGKDPVNLEDLVAKLRAHGIRADLSLKTSGRVARETAQAAVEGNEALVIAAGGDGTIEDVASQLVGSKTVLGILPLGTRNNLARELGIPLDLDLACALLGTGITRRIDVGRVRADEKPDVEYFLESAGIGLSAVVLPAGQELRKGRLGSLPRALRRLFDMKPGEIEIELDNETISANSTLVTVSNAPLLGLSFLVAPDAKMDDGLLDVAVYDGMTATDITAYFFKTTEGKRAYNPNVRFYKSKRVVIRSGKALPIASDGAVVGDRRTLEIEVLPLALAAVVGKGSGLMLPVDAVPTVTPLAGPQGAPKNGQQAPEAATAPTA